MTTITKQDVYESVINPCDYFFNGEPITGWVVKGNGIRIITTDAYGSTQYDLEWPCVVETSSLQSNAEPVTSTVRVSPAVAEPSTEKIVQHHVTKINGENRPCIPRTVIRVTEQFCEGYGLGVKGVVLDSPHLFLIGKSVKVDGRHKYINAYH
ncbi:hypothetical protein [Microcoleus phage My-WqHQDG]|nr:hypothetical protein [Microcoleus phage My-WqHQDG]